MSSPGDQVVRVGSVSFLNAKPLIWGLEHDPSIDLQLAVPSRLLDGMVQGRFDVALLPIIDYQRARGLDLISGGGICSDGQTLTVRIFSPVPIAQIETLACDTDSHTSVALARIILAEQFHVRPEFVALGPQLRPEAARLLIGDKVVCAAPSGLPYQLDLGEAWKQWTGLPFVFAAWVARQGIETSEISARLARARRGGMENVEQIIARNAVPNGWPADVARAYLTRHLQYDIGPRHLEAVRLFHRLAFEHRLIDHPTYELAVR